jgi:mannose-6-phosphate isomerase-like protein (cupin superfamily)
MQHFCSDSAESYAVGTVDVARWEQYALGETLPFQAMWYVVPPASSSPRDCHPEVELSVVISGTAAVEASGDITEVTQGSAFLLDSEEAHVIHNRSPDVPLRVFTTYWMPPQPPPAEPRPAPATATTAVDGTAGAAEGTP